MLTPTGVRISNCLLATQVQTVNVTQTETVGSLNYRYRLRHLWVSEMMLNVQSVSYFAQGHWILYDPASGT